MSSSRIQGGRALALAFVAIWSGCGVGKKPEPARSSSASESAPAAVIGDGLPRTLAELNAWYLEPRENGATFFGRGLEAMQTSPPGLAALPLLGQGKLPTPGTRLPSSLKSTLAALVQSNQEALRLFGQGAACESSRYPVDLSQGWESLLPHLPKLKAAASLAELSAVFHAETGDGKQATADVLIALGLARSLEAEPALLSQLVRAVSVSRAVAGLEQSASRAVLPQESLIELLRAFQRMEEHEARGDGFNRGLAAEFVISTALFAAPARLQQALGAGVKMSAEDRQEALARLQDKKKLAEEQTFLEESFQQLWSARQAPFPGRLRADDVVRQRVAQAAERKLPIVRVLLPGLGGAAAREAECLANLRLGETAVALEQFRAAHASRYPDSLSELTPEFLAGLPLDPFDGQPLRYRKTGGGHLLYSIGPDLKDDAGARRNGQGGDLIFEANGLASSRP